MTLFAATEPGRNHQADSGSDGVGDGGGAGGREEQFSDALARAALLCCAEEHMDQILGLRFVGPAVLPPATFVPDGKGKPENARDPNEQGAPVLACAVYKEAHQEGARGDAGIECGEVGALVIAADEDLEDEADAEGEAEEDEVEEPDCDGMPPALCCHAGDFSGLIPGPRLRRRAWEGNARRIEGGDLGREWTARVQIWDLIEKEGGTENMFPLLKKLYYADRTALIEWGQSITGDKRPWRDFEVSQKDRRRDSPY